jgi:hypothetical protein
MQQSHLQSQPNVKSTALFLTVLTVLCTAHCPALFLTGLQCPSVSCSLAVLYCLGPYGTVFNCPHNTLCRTLSCTVSLTALPCPSMSCTVPRCPVLSCTVLHCFSLSCTVSPCPALFLPVLHCFSLSCTVSPCPALFLHVLHCFSMSCTVFPCPALFFMSCTVFPCPALLCSVLHVQYKYISTANRSLGDGNIMCCCLLPFSYLTERQRFYHASISKETPQVLFDRRLRKYFFHSCTTIKMLPRFGLGMTALKARPID